MIDTGHYFELDGRVIRATPWHLVLDMMQTQVVEAWIALEPCIDGERELRVRTLSGDVSGRFLPHYEHLM